MDRDVIIIGGGLAGLSAAVQAIQHGFRPIILEKNKHLGGRVRSFYAPDIGREIDNGQHVLSAAYQETIRFIKTIGSEDQILYQKNFQTNFSKKDGTKLLFKTLSLPAPFHFFLPLIFSKNFTGVRLSGLWRFSWRNIGLSVKRIKQMTIKEWLEYTGQSTEVQKFLWQPLAYSILNTPVETGSAFLLKQAISKSFFHSRRNARLILPKSWLGDVFIAPAEKFLVKHGAEIHCLTTTEKIEFRDDRARKIVTSKGNFNAPWIISTVPPFALKEILENSGDVVIRNSITGLDKFEYNPIMTINIFLDRSIEADFPLAFIDSPLQWMFPHPHKAASQTDYGYALVISAANYWADKSREEIIDMVSVELLNHLGVRFETTHKLLKYKIIKEKRATIAQTPEFVRERPGTETGIPNFFLAGDWIDTGLPATIEGAMVSGRLAMESIIRQETNLN